MIKQKYTLLITMLLLALAIAGCGKKNYEPHAINENVDVCTICNMQVKDDAYATQIVTKQGKSLKFDDIGCMNEWKTKNGSDEIGKEYVRDYNDKAWIGFDEAAYVYDESLRTPMAYGVISFKDTASAEKFVQEQGVGKVLSAKELANHTWQQSKGMMEMPMNEKGH
jgi:copper chaperone NosL